MKTKLDVILWELYELYNRFLGNYPTDFGVIWNELCLRRMTDSYFSKIKISYFRTMAIFSETFQSSEFLFLKLINFYIYCLPHIFYIYTLEHYQNNSNTVSG